MDVSAPSTHGNLARVHRSRRALLGLALGAALAGMSGPAGSASAKPRPKPPGKGGGPARRRRRRQPRFKVVTRTFRSSAPIVINDEGPATPYPSVVTVAGLRQGKVLDLNVTLSGFTHEYPRDLDLLLVAPNGASAVVMSDVGHSYEVSNLTLVLDDQAAVPLPPDEQLVSGIYRPWNEAQSGESTDAFPAWSGTSSNVNLAIVNGTNPNGTWRLFVVDDASSDAGFIAIWSLTIKARIRT